MRKIRTGFIGVGGIAQAHLRALQEQESIEVVAVCDLVPERAETTAKRWGIKDTYTDYHELLARDDIESVNVCTYNQAHAQPSIDALRAGKNVLVEKPMAATLADATAMTAAAHASDKILMVAMPMRYSHNILAAKAIMDCRPPGRHLLCRDGHVAPQGQPRQDLYPQRHRRHRRHRRYRRVRPVCGHVPDGLAQAHLGQRHRQQHPQQAV